MNREAIKSLHDALSASEEIERFTARATSESYAVDRGLQLIVERLLLIVGEAVLRASRADENVLDLIPDACDIIGVRNRIVHGYDEINIGLVWDIAFREVPQL